jgi:hypothetical protein
MKNKLIQILLPLRNEKGKSFPQELYTELRSELTDKFGGITIYTRSPATGLWKNEKDNIERDMIVIYEVIADGFDRKYWQGLKVHLEDQFRQDQLIIRSMDIDLL